MLNINDEMKASADYAIKWAKERFGQDLDFTEESIGKLNNILGQIYQGFSNFTKDEAEKGLILNTAVIWGSYLGEYMCNNWGGTWISKGSDQLVSIENNHYSPISFVYQKITSHPEYSVDDYLFELNIKKHLSISIPLTSQYPSEIISQPTQSLPEIISQPKGNHDQYGSKVKKHLFVFISQASQNLSDILNQLKKRISIIQSIKSVTIDKDLLSTFAVIGGILFVTLGGIFGYKIIKAGGLSAFGFVAVATSSNTNVPIEKTLVTETPYSTNSPSPTVTLLPTYTPNPTYTPQPSHTSQLTYTQNATSTLTQTKTPFIPTHTRIPIISPTFTQINSPNTPLPPAITPSPTVTMTPLRTATRTPTRTATRTLTPTATRTPTITATRTTSPTATNTPIPTATNTPIPTATNIPIPTATNIPIPTATNTPIPTETNTPIPTETNTPIPTETRKPLPTSKKTPSPTVTRTP